MANANFEPMPFIRKFGSDKLESVGTTSYGAATSSAVVLEESPFIELSGVTRMRVPVSGACRKCGYAGHLAFQCRNLIQPKNCADTFLDVSSTSSESDYETPLTAKGSEKHKKKKKDKTERKKEKEHRKKRKKEKKENKDKGEHKHKKRKRRHSNSSSSTSPSDHRKKHHHHHKKTKKHRHRSDSSSDSS